MSTEKALLVHGYLVDRGDKRKPDRLTRLGLLAAAELYRHGVVDKICFTLVEELTDLQVKRINVLLNNPPEEDIVLQPEAVTTRGEIKTFKALAEANGWVDLFTVGYPIHIPRIKKETERTFKDRKVVNISTKDVLFRFIRYHSILSDLENWPEHKSLDLNEKILNEPLLGSLIMIISPYISGIKIAMQTWIFNQIERH